MSVFSTPGKRKCCYSILAFLLLSSLTSCNLLPFKQEVARSQQENKSQNPKKITAVDGAIARLGTLRTVKEYIGTTFPVREVSLRSQVQGWLLSLELDRGDGVVQGEVVATLDDTLLATEVNRAEAELAALKSELARARAEVSNARTQLQRAILELEEAKSDQLRFAQLAAEGAISRTEAESSTTAAGIAKQTVLSAEEQIRIEEQAVAAVVGRIEAQKAVIAQERERQAYTNLIAPITGIVLERNSEPGNLVVPGEEVITLGDFSKIKIIVPVSELDLASIVAGQSAKVKLDAVGDRSFIGRVSRISPVADTTTRQVPVEVIIANSEDNHIGSGLLARVSFSEGTKPRVIIPESALIKESTLFVINPEEKSLGKVEARVVEVGDRANGKVEIISGIQPGERFVLKSSKPLEDGEMVRLSILSE